MKKHILLTLLIAAVMGTASAQSVPLDTSTWNIQAMSYVLENFKGKDAIYLQGGSMTLKDRTFLDGTIEYDIFLKKEQAFPGIYFRAQEDKDAEQFYIRPHLPGKPDANQAGAALKGVTPWQLYFGPRYSFAYDYKYDDWTHVKVCVNGNQAQVFLDYSEEPQLSWNTFTEVKSGAILFTGGNRSGMHIASIKISDEAPEMKNFDPVDREPLEGIIQEWNLSDKFSEKMLNEPGNLGALIEERNWVGAVKAEEGTAAIISRVHDLRDGTGTNTVFAKVIIDSRSDQLKLFEFGYSDRVVAILNGKPIYRGTNRWRSRDYRYLGTVGLFDAIYLDLKKGENELLLAVSEDFGGWLVTGRIADQSGIRSIK